MLSLQRQIYKDLWANTAFQKFQKTKRRKKAKTKLLLPKINSYLREVLQRYCPFDPEVHKSSHKKKKNCLGYSYQKKD